MLHLAFGREVALWHQIEGGVSVFSKMQSLRGLLIVGGSQCSIDSLGTQAFQMYCN